MSNIAFSEPEYDSLTGRFKSTAIAANAHEIVARNTLKINRNTNYQVEISYLGNTITLLGTTVELVNYAINIIC